MNSRRNLLKTIPALALSSAFPRAAGLLAAFAAEPVLASTSSGTVPPTTMPWIVVKPKTNRIQYVSPGMFGFNMPWGNMEGTASGATSGLTPTQLGIMQDKLMPFQGALFRYPGGTPSNYFNWRYATGPASQRQPQYWAGLPAGLSALQFGVDEFFAMVKAVGGKAIYTLNLFMPGIRNADGTWTVNRKWTGDTRITDCTNEIEALVRYIYSKGYNEYVAYYELGNELDLGSSWTPSEYAAYADNIIYMLRTIFNAAPYNDPNIKLLIHGDTYALTTTWIAGVTTAMQQKPDGIALHMYYDPPHQTNVSVQNYASWVSTNQRAKVVSIKPTWADVNYLITEHAIYDPCQAGGGVACSAAADSGGVGAMSAADFTLASFNNPYIMGTVWHAIEQYPWALFHPDGATDLFGSATYAALLALRKGFSATQYQAMGNDPQDTSVFAAPTGIYAYDYGLRVSVIQAVDPSTNTPLSQGAVLGINRNDFPVKVVVTWSLWPSTASLNYYKTENLAATDPTISVPADNTVSNKTAIFCSSLTPVTATFSGGTWTIIVPGRSVYSIIQS